MVTTGKIEAGFPAGMSKRLNGALNGENRLQSGLFMFIQPGNIFDFTADSLFDASRILLYSLKTIQILLIGTVKKTNGHPPARTVGFLSDQTDNRLCGVRSCGKSPSGSASRQL